MADQTLTGCIDLSTGLATFDQDDCEYSGCMEFAGEHAGQVAVQINTSTCDDTYYGCVNLITRQFEVIVPDDCCAFSGSICPRNCSAEDVPACYAVTFSGQTLCSGCRTQSPFNGGQIHDSLKIFGKEVIAVPAFPFPDPCVFEKSQDTGSAVYARYTYTGPEAGCGFDPSPAYITFSTLTVRITFNNGFVVLHGGWSLILGAEPSTAFFAGVAELGEDCENIKKSLTIQNGNECRPGRFFPYAVGGIGTMRPVPCP